MAYRTYSTANGWIVDKKGKGDFTSIGAAITAFNAAVTAGSLTNIDVFLHVNTYTENFTIPPGMNLIGFTGDGDTPNITIIGKITMSAAGTSTISNCRVQTNSDFFIVNSGSAASILTLDNCYLNCSNNTGISFTSSSASAGIRINYCQGDLGTTGIGFHSSSSPGQIIYQSSFFTNSGSSLSSSSNSSGGVIIRFSGFFSAFSTSGTGIFINDHSYIDCGTINKTALTTAGTGVLNQSFHGFYKGQSASAVVIGAGTTLNSLSDIMISNATNSVDGAGTIIYGAMNFGGTTNLDNVTTKTGRQLQVGSISFDGGVTSLNALPVPVTDGGTGLATTTAYGVITGGTTATGNFQNAGTGAAASTVLIGNGSAALPSFSATPSLTGLGIGAASTGSGLTFDGSNTLANYATGTFTPALARTSLSITYISQTGRYTRIGNRVYIFIDMQFNAISNAGSGATTITGLPFNSANANAGGFNAIYQNLANFPTGLHVLSAFTINATTTANLWMTGGLTAPAQTVTPTAAPGEITLVGFYEV